MRRGKGRRDHLHAASDRPAGRDDVRQGARGARAAGGAARRDGPSPRRGEHHRAAALHASDLTLTVRAGEVIGLAGLEGSGQRTFLRACAGLLRPDQGRLRWATRTSRAPVSSLPRCGRALPSRRAPGRGPAVRGSASPSTSPSQRCGRLRRGLGSGRPGGRTADRVGSRSAGTPSTDRRRPLRRQPAAAAPGPDAAEHQPVAHGAPHPRARHRIGRLGVGQLLERRDAGHRDGVRLRRPRRAAALQRSHPGLLLRVRSCGRSTGGDGRGTSSVGSSAGRSGFREAGPAARRLATRTSTALLPVVLALVLVAGLLLVVGRVRRSSALRDIWDGSMARSANSATRSWPGCRSPWPARGWWSPSRPVCGTSASRARSPWGRSRPHGSLGSSTPRRSVVLIPRHVRGRCDRRDAVGRSSPGC